MKKRKKAFKNLIIFTIIVSFTMLLLVQGIIKSIFLPEDNISINIKEKIALAGKNYLINQDGKKIVFLDELIKKGYITDKDYLNENNCMASLSSVSVNQLEKDKYKFYVDLYCNSNFSHLTLSN